MCILQFTKKNSFCSRQKPLKKATIENPYNYSADGLPPDRPVSMTVV